MKEGDVESLPYREFLELMQQKKARKKMEKFCEEKG
jgi:hypothetical protein